MTTGDPSIHPAIYSVIIHCDNQGAIALGKNPQAHARSKHINIQWHYQREEIEDRTVQLRYIPTNQQITDGLTKPLSKDKFLAFRNAVGLELFRPVVQIMGELNQELAKKHIWPIVYIMDRYVKTASGGAYTWGRLNMSGPIHHSFSFHFFKVVGVSLLSPFFLQSSGIIFYWELSAKTRAEWECQNLGLVQLLVMHTGGGQHILSDSQMYKDSLDLPHSLNE